jgi:hypothetical protein
LERLQKHVPGSAMAAGERGSRPEITPSIGATSRTEWALDRDVDQASDAGQGTTHKEHPP